MILLNHYIVSDKDGKPIYWTLAPTRDNCLSKFLYGMSDESTDWVYWFKKGYKCKNVDVNFTEAL